MPAPVFNSVMPTMSVADLDRAIGFYTDALGFALRFRNGTTFAVLARDALEISLMASAFSGVATGTGRCYFKLGSGIDDLYAGYLSRSVSIRHVLREEEYGMREFMIADVDGNEVNFGQAIP